jgi:hypothetical protein
VVEMELARVSSDECDGLEGACWSPVSKLPLLLSMTPDAKKRIRSPTLVFVDARGFLLEYRHFLICNTPSSHPITRLRLYIRAYLYRYPTAILTSQHDESCRDTRRDNGL